jgi:hypothetical protein
VTGSLALTFAVVLFFQVAANRGLLIAMARRSRIEALGKRRYA